ncbi:recombinase family protein [Nocardia sp. NPDC051463]|uniref:recombinase family protein n=1 Tax=Nocardia sp. NPDC051463 TaxID=3154845 RepID=UPI00344DF376
MTDQAVSGKRARLRVAAQLRVVIYARVSKPGDRSIREQEKVGRRDCAENGWVVVAVFSDKLSASRYRKVQERPGFIAAMDFIRNGGAEMLWTFANNRAHRDLDDYVLLRRLCIDTRALWRYGQRTYDLSKSADRQATAADALRAEGLSDDISDAVNRSFEDKVDAGTPHGRLARGYKIVWDKDTGKAVGRKPIKAQAKIIRAGAERVLRLESLYSVSKDLAPAWKEAGGKGELTARTLRLILINPTYAGLRTHEGEVTGKATWKGVIKLDQHTRLRALLTNPARVTHRGSGPAYLLSHIARCGVCSERVVAKPRRRKGCVLDNYACPAGHVARSIARVDAHVEELLLQLLERPETLAQLNAVEEEVGGRTIDDELTEIAELRANLKNFVRDAARKKPPLSALVVGAYEDEINVQIAEADKRMKAMIGDPVVADAVGPDARKRWAKRDLVQRREVVRRVMSVMIVPVVRRGRYSAVGVEVDPIGALVG